MCAAKKKYFCTIVKYDQKVFQELSRTIVSYFTQWIHKKNFLCCANSFKRPFLYIHRWILFNHPLVKLICFFTALLHCKLFVKPIKLLHNCSNKFSIFTPPKKPFMNWIIKVWYSKGVCRHIFTPGVRNKRSNSFESKTLCGWFLLGL